ncbi:MAG: hypothetical protein K8S16_10375, partial [Bacteroidales bacterium]|nr:hypothetical protein [Bacteroidales bacterium]
MVVALAISGFVFGQFVSSTYTAGDIPTNYGSYSATCNGTATPLTVTLPIGSWVVTSVDVVYDITALGSAWKSEQRSRLACVESGTNEGGYLSG